MRVLLMSLLLSLLSSAQNGLAEGPKAERPAKKGQVIDLGQLEIEGEVRRPNVTWIDSQKKLQNMLPVFHRSEFQALEEQLVRPMTQGDLKAKLGSDVASGGEDARD